jgi:pyridoxal 5'-phosphate synthase pdxT subunit
VNRPAVGVLALQGDVPEHLRAIGEAGGQAAGVRRPAELDAVDALVIPGGESTTLWKLATAFDLFDPIAARISGGMPVFGSCAGMIMLADRLADGTDGQRTFGGIDMTVRRNAFGRQVDSFETDVTIAGVTTEGAPLHAVFIRAPAVEEAGEHVTVLAKDDRTGRIVAVRQGQLLATAFHPELTPDRRMHQLFIDIVRGNR